MKEFVMPVASKIDSETEPFRLSHPMIGSLINEIGELFENNVLKPFALSVSKNNGE